jgi:hypothetical protein
VSRDVLSTTSPTIGGVVVIKGKEPEEHEREGEEEGAVRPESAAARRHEVEE